MIRDYGDILNVCRSVQYNFVVTSAIPKGSQTLTEYIRAYDVEAVEWNIIMQILLACYAMESVRLAHNDLHTGNIYLVKQRDSVVCYKYGGKVYTFKTDYKVMVYDFDRSWHPALGDNPLLSKNELGDNGVSRVVGPEGVSCTRANQCNEFVRGKDVMKVFGYLIERIDDQAYYGARTADLLSIISDEDNDEKIMDIYTRSLFLRERNSKRMEPKDFEILYPIREMLDKCWEFVEDKLEEHEAGDNVFTIE